jgi:hypothetical protein
MRKFFAVLWNLFSKRIPSSARSRYRFILLTPLAEPPIKTIFTLRMPSR